MEKIKIYTSNNSKSFSLIELIVVIAIIGILSSMVLVYVRGAREQALAVRAQTECREIYNIFILLEADTNQWPGHKTPYLIKSGVDNNEICPEVSCSYGLSDPRAGLVATDGDYPNWKGPYLDPGVLIDSWGHEYFFDTDYDIQPGDGEQWAAVIGSYGPNGVGNDLYDADDAIYVIIKK